MFEEGSVNFIVGDTTCAQMDIVRGLDDQAVVIEPYSGGTPDTQSKTMQRLRVDYPDNTLIVFTNCLFILNSVPGNVFVFEEGVLVDSGVNCYGMPLADICVFLFDTWSIPASVREDFDVFWEHLERERISEAREVFDRMCGYLDSDGRDIISAGTALRKSEMDQ